MRMPQATRQPLPEHLEALRQAVAALSDDDRKLLAGWLWGDTIRRNDHRAQEHYERAERERNRRRPDPRQMRLDGAA